MSENSLPPTLRVCLQDTLRGCGEMLKPASSMMVLWNDAHLGGTLVVIPPSSSTEGQAEVPGGHRRLRARS